MPRDPITCNRYGIKAGKVDTIVVYKIDRLTRSLADFAKMVELFDERGITFVSVTQQFNTTTSMGRLTLNVLLSFAQFEREVTGERIRDKIAASKKKGMWMGGNVPLGYDAKDRKLIINKKEAETVRNIFHRYAELGSVHSLREELQADGNRMTPTHAVKNAKRYRYYISRSLTTATRKTSPAGIRIPAREIEQLVSQRLMEFLTSASDLVDAVKRHVVGSRELRQVIEDAASLVNQWPKKSPSEKRSVFMALIQRIDIRDKTTAIHLSVNYLCKLFQRGSEDCPAAVSIPSKEQALTLRVGFDLKRCGLGVRMLIDGNPAGGKTEPDMKLIRLIAKAHRISQRLTNNSGLSISDIAKEEGYSGSYASRLLRLAFLSPRITTAILNGRQPANLTPATLMRDSKYPIDWQQQLQVIATI